jgi:hypothetical protein
MINVTLGEAKTQEKDFPKLMTLKNGVGGVFYFMSENKCVCLDSHQLKEWKDGEYYAGNGLSDSYKDFNEIVTLQNA